MPRNTRSRMTYGILAGAAVFAVAAYAPAYASVTTSSVRSDVVNVNGRAWKSVPYVVSGGTTYFGIWYLQQLLSQYGISNTWDGQNLRITALPSSQASSETSINGATLPSSPALTYQGQTFVNVSGIAQALGGSTQFSATTSELNVSLPTSATSVSSARVTLRKTHSTPHFDISGNSVAATDRASDVRPVLASSTSSISNGALYENNQLWRKVPILRRDGTTFFGVWYLQQWLNAHGIQNQWNGKSLSLTGLPNVHHNVTIGGGAGEPHASVLELNGAYYIPTTILPSLGIQVLSAGTSGNISLQSSAAGASTSATLKDSEGQPMVGRVAVSDGTGRVVVETTDNAGQFVAPVQPGAGTVVGIESSDSGWVGQSLPIQQEGQVLTAASQQMMTTISGRLMFSGSAFPVTEVSVRNDITHAHYYAQVQSDGSFQMTVPVGGYEAFALVSNDNPVFLVQPFLATTGNLSITISVPALPTSNQLSTAHATVVAEDGSVKPEQLLSVSQMMEHVYVGDVADTGIQPAGPVTITLYGTTSSYQQHFLDEGYSSTEAQQIAQNAVATDEGTDTISVLMPAFNSVDGLNILAHEFTHALIANVTSGIPSWANEGIAWTEGIRGEEDGSPDTTLMDGLEWAQWSDIVSHQKKGDLLPLDNPNPLAGNYNVESQDYYAVQQLIQQFGFQKYMAYVKATETDSNAFQDTFGMTFDAFAAQVTASLNAQANTSDTGFTIRLHILTNGPDSAYIIRPDGSRVGIQGLQPDKVYNITCRNDGTVQVPAGLTITQMANVSVAVTGDWFIGCGAAGTTQSRQEFDIEHAYGVPYLVQALLYDGQDNLEHAYPATAIPDGLSIVSLTSNR